MRIVGEKIRRTNTEVCEIAPSATGDEDFLAEFLVMLKNENRSSAFAGFDGAHQTGCASSDNYDIIGFQVLTPGHVVFGFPMNMMENLLTVNR